MKVQANKSVGRFSFETIIRTNYFADESYVTDVLTFHLKEIYLNVCIIDNKAISS